MSDRRTDEVWHVTKIPADYLTAGMDTILIFEHRFGESGRGYIKARIRDDGYLEAFGDTYNPHLILMDDRYLDGSIPEQRGDA